MSSMKTIMASDFFVFLLYFILFSLPIPLLVLLLFFASFLPFNYEHHYQKCIDIQVILECNFATKNATFTAVWR